MGTVVGIAAQHSRSAWTRPLVILNLLAIAGLLASVVLFFLGDAVSAYLTIVLTNLPVEGYIALIAPHLH